MSFVEGHLLHPERAEPADTETAMPFEPDPARQEFASLEAGPQGAERTTVVYVPTPAGQATVPPPMQELIGTSISGLAMAAESSPLDEGNGSAPKSVLAGEAELPWHTPALQQLTPEASGSNTPAEPAEPLQPADAAVHQKPIPFPENDKPMAEDVQAESPEKEKETSEPAAFI